MEIDWWKVSTNEEKGEDEQEDDEPLDQRPQSGTTKRHLVNGIQSKFSSRIRVV